MDSHLVNILGSVVSNATPLVIAALGETITERAGVVNLSLDGSIVLAAMLGFIVALTMNSVVLGLLAAMLAGALMALLVAVGGIALRRDQVAVGFILTLLGADLAQFLGQNYTRVPGPQLATVPIPILSEIPVLGTIFFRHDGLVYFSFVLLFGVWFWLYRTPGGLAHRAVGERPEAAFARGIKVNRQRYLYAMLGGALVGLAGAAYSLSIKPGWATPPAMRGDGWIALAIVIFGGWHPFRVALGAYLFAALRALSTAIQSSPEAAVSPVLLNMLPWLLMIGTLVLVSGGVLERVVKVLPRPAQRAARNFLRSDPPAALGTRFEPD